MAKAERDFVYITCGKTFKSRNWKPDKDPKYCNRDCQLPKNNKNLLDLRETR